MRDRLAPGTLMAYTGMDQNVIRRIVRVVEDRGHEVEVESDDKLESEAAIEHDFPTPEPVVLIVEPERLRPIIEK